MGKQTKSNLGTRNTMVNHLSVLGQNFLASAVGTGFKIFHIHSGQCVLECAQGHDGIVTDVIPLYDNSRIATCSLDGHIRIWGSPHQTDLPSVFRVENNKSSLRSKSTTDVSSSHSETLLVRRDEPLQAKLFGDLCVHHEAVTKLVMLSAFEFVSSGNDGMVVIWRDGRLVRYLRDFQSSDNLRMHNVHQFSHASLNLTRENENEMTEGEDMSLDPYEVQTLDEPESFTTFHPKAETADLSSYTSAQQKFIQHIIEMKKVTATNRESSGFPTGQGGGFALPPNRTSVGVTLPSHTVEYARILKLEQKKTVTEVCDTLSGQGYSDNFVRLISRRI